MFLHALRSCFVLLTLFLVTNTGLIAGQETTPSSVGVTTNSIPQATTGIEETFASSTDYYGSETSTTSDQNEKGSQQDNLVNEDIKLGNCSTPANLENYCKNSVNAKFFDFFKEDSSVIGMLSSIIKPRIVYELQKHCNPGQWCLPESFQKEIADEMEILYDQSRLALCRNDFWKCLESIEFRRKLCNESELFFLMSTVGALCDMRTIEEGITRECFTRTVEAITVLYSDLSNQNETATISDTCTPYNHQMINTYGCATKSCTIEQRVFLKDFGPWSKLSSNAMAIANQCDLKLDCHAAYTLSEASQPQSENSPIPKRPNAESINSTNSPDANGTVVNQTKITNSTEQDQENAKIEEEVDDMMLNEEKIVEEILEEVVDEVTTQSVVSNTENSNTYQDIFREEGMDTQDNYEMADTTFVYGMVTVTAVVIVSLTIVGVMAFKRFSRIRRNYKMGYSQMSEEECRMLKNEYN